jgi:hypothetical protein
MRSRATSLVAVAPARMLSFDPPLFAIVVSILLQNAWVLRQVLLITAAYTSRSRLMSKNNQDQLIKYYLGIPVPVVLQTAVLDSGDGIKT